MKYRHPLNLDFSITEAFIKTFGISITISDRQRPQDVSVIMN